MPKTKSPFRPRPTRASKMHQHVRSLLAKLYPGFVPIEESPIEVVLDGRPKTLFVDLVVRELQLAIECQGIQHDRFTPHFHRTSDDLRSQQNRDQAKQQAINQAGYTYLAIRHDEWQQLTARGLLRRVQRAIKENS